MRPYKSSFETWYSRAAVRSRPRRTIGLNAGGRFRCFPLDLAPVCTHPLVVELGEAVVGVLLAKHLIAYLNFTDTLENEVVGCVTRRIATSASRYAMPDRLQIDAYKIYCDEAYHSLFSVDIRDQVGNAFRVPTELTRSPEAFRWFRVGPPEVPPDLRQLFFVIVTETLISSMLTRVPCDHDVFPAVRQMMDDHAADEARHRAFFANVCEMVWPQLPPAQQRQIGSLLPLFIVSFLDPDFSGIRNHLMPHLSAAQVDQVLHESYPPEKRVADLRNAAAFTLELFRRVGVLEDEDVAAAFDSVTLPQLSDESTSVCVLVEARRTAAAH
jgi:hypothetical protein